MDFNLSDLLFLAIVLWMVIELLDNGDWGSGHRVRIGDLAPVPAGCPL